jgi:gamma-glutamyltranspeptidase
VRADPGLSGVFSREGQPLTGTLKQPALALTLAELAEDPQDFYRGEVAARLLQGLRDLGSPLSAADFANHRAEQPAPLTVETDHGTWWGAPPPAQGAIALALIRDWSHADGLALARRAHAARAQLLGDPAGGEIDLDGLLHPSGELTASALSAARAAGDTVAVTAVDRDGTAVALIQSVYQTFGAGLLEPATGVVMHNRGSAFVVLEDPQEHARHPARLQPGLRPPHTLCPLIGESATNRVTVALGCQGGRAQPLILAQVAADLIDPEQPIEPTLARPRWVVGDRDLGFGVETILIESPEATPSSGQLPVLSAEDGGDDRCGHVQVARLTETGLESGADPRADGSAIVTG